MKKEKRSTLLTEEKRQRRRLFSLVFFMLLALSGAIYAVQQMKNAPMANAMVLTSTALDPLDKTALTVSNPNGGTTEPAETINLGANSSVTLNADGTGGPTTGVTSGQNVAGIQAFLANVTDAKGNTANTSNVNGNQSITITDQNGNSSVVTIPNLPVWVKVQDETVLSGTVNTSTDMTTSANLPLDPKVSQLATSQITLNAGHVYFITYMALTAQGIRDFAGAGGSEAAFIASPMNAAADLVSVSIKVSVLNTAINFASAATNTYVNSKTTSVTSPLNAPLVQMYDGIASLDNKGNIIASAMLSNYGTGYGSGFYFYTGGATASIYKSFLSNQIVAISSNMSVSAFTTPVLNPQTSGQLQKVGSSSIPTGNWWTYDHNMPPLTSGGSKDYSYGQPIMTPINAFAGPNAGESGKIFTTGENVSFSPQEYFNSTPSFSTNASVAVSGKAYGTAISISNPDTGTYDLQGNSITNFNNIVNGKPIYCIVEAGPNGGTTETYTNTYNNNAVNNLATGTYAPGTIMYSNAPSSLLSTVLSQLSPDNGTTKATLTTNFQSGSSDYQLPTLFDYPPTGGTGNTYYILYMISDGNGGWITSTAAYDSAHVQIGVSDFTSIATTNTFTWTNDKDGSLYSPENPLEPSLSTQNIASNGTGQPLPVVPDAVGQYNVNNNYMQVEVRQLNPDGTVGSPIVNMENLLAPPNATKADSYGNMQTNPVGGSDPTKTNNTMVWGDIYVVESNQQIASNLTAAGAAAYAAWTSPDPSQYSQDISGWTRYVSATDNMSLTKYYNATYTDSSGKSWPTYHWLWGLPTTNTDLLKPGHTYLENFFALSGSGMYDYPRFVAQVGAGVAVNGQTGYGLSYSGTWTSTTSDPTPTIADYYRYLQSKYPGLLTIAFAYNTTTLTIADDTSVTSITKQGQKELDGVTNGAGITLQNGTQLPSVQNPSLGVGQSLNIANFVTLKNADDTVPQTPQGTPINAQDLTIPCLWNVNTGNNGTTYSLTTAGTTAYNAWTTPDKAVYPPTISGFYEYTFGQDAANGTSNLTTYFTIANQTSSYTSVTVTAGGRRENFYVLANGQSAQDGWGHSIPLDKNGNLLVLNPDGQVSQNTNDTSLNDYYKNTLTPAGTSAYASWTSPDVKTYSQDYIGFVNYTMATNMTLLAQYFDMTAAGYTAYTSWTSPDTTLYKQTPTGFYDYISFKSSSLVASYFYTPTNSSFTKADNTAISFTNEGAGKYASGYMGTVTDSNGVTTPQWISGQPVYQVVTPDTNTVNGVNTPDGTKISQPTIYEFNPVSSLQTSYANAVNSKYTLPTAATQTQNSVLYTIPSSAANAGTNATYPSALPPATTNSATLLPVGTYTMTWQVHNASGYLAPDPTNGTLTDWGQTTFTVGPVAPVTKDATISANAAFYPGIVTDTLTDSNNFQQFVNSNGSKDNVMLPNVNTDGNNNPAPVLMKVASDYGMNNIIFSGDANAFNLDLLHRKAGTYYVELFVTDNAGGAIYSSMSNPNYSSTPGPSKLIVTDNTQITGKSGGNPDDLFDYGVTGITQYTPSSELTGLFNADFGVATNALPKTTAAASHMNDLYNADTAQDGGNTQSVAGQAVQVNIAAVSNVASDNTAGGVDNIANNPLYNNANFVDSTVYAVSWNGNATTAHPTTVTPGYTYQETYAVLTAAGVYDYQNNDASSETTSQYIKNVLTANVQGTVEVGTSANVNTNNSGALVYEYNSPTKLTVADDTNIVAQSTPDSILASVPYIPSKVGVTTSINGQTIYHDEIKTAIDADGNTTPGGYDDGTGTVISAPGAAISIGTISKNAGTITGTGATPGVIIEIKDTNSSGTYVYAIKTNTDGTWSYTPPASNNYTSADTVVGLDCPNGNINGMGVLDVINKTGVADPLVGGTLPDGTTGPVSVGFTATANDLTNVVRGSYTVNFYGLTARGALDYTAYLNSNSLTDTAANMLAFIRLHKSAVETSPDVTGTNDAEYFSVSAQLSMTVNDQTDISVGDTTSDSLYAGQTTYKPMSDLLKSSSAYLKDAGGVLNTDSNQPVPVSPDNVNGEQVIHYADGTTKTQPAFPVIAYITDPAQNKSWSINADSVFPAQDLVAEPQPYQENFYALTWSGAQDYYARITGTGLYASGSSLAQYYDPTLTVAEYVEDIVSNEGGIYPSTEIVQGQQNSLSVTPILPNAFLIKTTTVNLQVTDGTHLSLGGVVNMGDNTSLTHTFNTNISYSPFGDLNLGAAGYSKNADSTGVSATNSTSDGAIDINPQNTFTDSSGVNHTGAPIWSSVVDDSSGLTIWSNPVKNGQSIPTQNLLGSLVGRNYTETYTGLTFAGVNGFANYLAEYPTETDGTTPSTEADYITYLKTVQSLHPQWLVNEAAVKTQAALAHVMLGASLNPGIDASSTYQGTLAVQATDTLTVTDQTQLTAANSNYVINSNTGGFTPDADLTSSSNADGTAGTADTVNGNAIIARITRQADNKQISIAADNSAVSNATLAQAGTYQLSYFALTGAGADNLLGTFGTIPAGVTDTSSYVNYVLANEKNLVAVKTASGYVKLSDGSPVTAADQMLLVETDATLTVTDETTILSNASNLNHGLNTDYIPGSDLLASLGGKTALNADGSAVNVATASPWTTSFNSNAVYVNVVYDNQSVWTGTENEKVQYSTNSSSNTTPLNPNTDDSILVNGAGDYYINYYALNAAGEYAYAAWIAANDSAGTAALANSNTTQAAQDLTNFIKSLTVAQLAADTVTTQTLITVKNNTTVISNGTDNLMTASTNPQAPYGSYNPVNDFVKSTDPSANAVNAVANLTVNPVQVNTSSNPVTYNASSDASLTIGGKRLSIVAPPNSVIYTANTSGGTTQTIVVQIMNSKGVAMVPNSDGTYTDLIPDTYTVNYYVTDGIGDTLTATTVLNIKYFVLPFTGSTGIAMLIALALTLAGFTFLFWKKKKAEEAE